MIKILIISLLFIPSIICNAQDIQTYSDYENLIKITRSGDTIALKTALKGRDIEQVINSVENIPLIFYACGSRNENAINMVRFLLDKGANSNRITKYGTPANWAAEKGHLDRLDLLLDYGFNPRIEEMKYWIEISETDNIFIPEWMKKIITELKDRSINYSNYPYLEYSDPLDPLLLTAAIFYCKDGNYDVAKRIISSGANVDLFDKNGLTALLHSVNLLDYSAMSFLIENNSDVNLQISFSESAMEFLSKSNKFYNNMTPLNLLLHKVKENPETLETELDKILLMTKTLIDAGADVKIKHNNKTPLQVAEEINNRKIIRILKSAQ